MAESQLLILGPNTIANLDRGVLGATLEKAIARAVADCTDRPSDDRERRVELVFSMKPVSDVRDNIVYCDGVTGNYQVRAKIPNWQGPKLDFGVRKSKGVPVLVFNEESPSNHKQTTMEFEEEQRK